MTSKEFGRQLSELVDATEINLKKIESFNGEFVTTALNEWRYATRHIVDAMCDIRDEENRTMAICHLHRAYFDSCDILLTCILSRFYSLHDEFRDIASVVAKHVEGYADKCDRIREIAKLYTSVKKSDKREELYTEIAKACDDAEKIVNAFESTADVWRDEIRRTRRNDRLALVGVAIGVATLVVGIIALFR